MNGTFYNCTVLIVELKPELNYFIIDYPVWRAGNSCGEALLEGGRPETAEVVIVPALPQFFHLPPPVIPRRLPDPIFTMRTATVKTHSFLSHILDTMEEACYVSDLVTYDLLYLNKAGRDIIRNSKGATSGKCYRVLQQIDAPCDFCTNHLLEEGKNHVWERYNPYLERYYALTDTIIKVGGRNYRFEIAKDVTEYKIRQHDLQRKLALEENLVSCVKCLTSEYDIAGSMNKLLSIVGEYYQAGRAYIFEIHYDRDSIENTYEWCRPGISPQIENLKNVPLPAIDFWMERFKEQGAFSISSLDALDRNSLEYRILEPQGIKSLMAAPLVTKGLVVGFLGVDNPTASCGEFQLLRAVPFFIQDELVKRRMIEQLEWLSFRDTLTGLYNRNKYATALNGIMACPPDSLGVIYVDVNGLKAANDIHGHEYGDRIIRKVASHMKAAVTGDIYRIGGDEFIILCPHFSEQALNRMVKSLRERMAEENEASIAIGSSWNDGEVNPQELVRFADHRMYAEKQSYYKSQLAAESSHKSDAVSRLHAAIQAGEFKVVMQAGVSLTTGEIIGAEAFIRKQDACLGMIPPDRFLPVYEMEGIVRHLDFHVLETVCAAMHVWKQEGNELPVTVNLSRMTVMENNIVTDIEEMCHAHEVDPSLLRIKISKASSKMELRLLKGLAADFRRKGFPLALGGFCSIESSLALLGDIEFDEVRIDKDFIQGIETSAAKQAILEHALSLCNSLGIRRTLAEGVENALQYDLLRRTQCDCCQGELFCGFMGLEGFHGFRRKWEGPRLHCR